MHGVDSGLPRPDFRRTELLRPPTTFPKADAHSSRQWYGQRQSSVDERQCCTFRRPPREPTMTRQLRPMTDIQDVFLIKNEAANWTLEEVRQRLLPTIDLLSDKLDALLRSPYRQNIYPVLLGLITLLRHHGERLWEQNAARPDAHQRSSRVIHVLLAVRHLSEADERLRQHAAKAFELLPLQWRAREAPPRGAAFPVYQAPFPVYPRPGVFVPRCVPPHRPMICMKPYGPTSPAISLYSASPALSLYSAHPHKQGSNLSSLARQVVDSDVSESPCSPLPGQPLRRPRSSTRPSRPRRWSGAGLETFPIPDLLRVGCRKHPVFIPPASPQKVQKVPRPQLEVWAQTLDIGPRIRKALFKLAQKKAVEPVG